MQLERVQEITTKGHVARYHVSEEKYHIYMIGFERKKCRTI